MDQGAACCRGDLLDGRHALSAEVVRLSLRIGNRIETVRDVQGDGTEVTEGDYQSGDDRDLAGGALPRLGRALVLCRLVARQTSAGAGIIGYPRFFCPLGQGFRRRPEYQESEILPYYQ